MILDPSVLSHSQYTLMQGLVDAKKEIEKLTKRRTELHAALDKLRAQINVCFHN
jgi:hypothetical protein